MGRPVRIIEVGPRDGLQNESVEIPTAIKLEFIRALAEAGLKEIEATSFVSPKWVPQLADAVELWPMLPPGPLYSALVPNMRGLQSALSVGCGRIAVFTAASNEFTKRNVNMTVDETIAAFREVIERFRSDVKGSFVRGYVSTAFECPYVGRVSPTVTSTVVNRLFELGVDEVSIGDTIGVATPQEVLALHSELGDVDPNKIAWHFHDTRGTAIANVAACLSLGYQTFDASAAGLGGCPYAKGAGGNLATEDLVYFLEREGVLTGIEPLKLAEASLLVLEHLRRSPAAKAQVATLSAR